VTFLAVIKSRPFINEWKKKKKSPVKMKGTQAIRSSTHTSIVFISVKIQEDMDREWMQKSKYDNKNVQSWKQREKRLLKFCAMKHETSSQGPWIGVVMPFSWHVGKHRPWDPSRWCVPQLAAAYNSRWMYTSSGNHWYSQRTLKNRTPPYLEVGICGWIILL